MKIVIVDDSKVARAMIRMTLRQAGFGGMEVLEAETGNEALKLVQDQRPDVVLCDWNMPGMNGMEVLKKLRAAGNTVRFGFVTSEGNATSRREARNAGASFLIAKPYDAEDFRNSLMDDKSAA